MTRGCWSFLWFPPPTAETEGWGGVPMGFLAPPTLWVCCGPLPCSLSSEGPSSPLSDQTGNGNGEVVNWRLGTQAARASNLDSSWLGFGGRRTPVRGPLRSK